FNTFKRSEVETIDRLNPQDRAVLEARLQALKDEPLRMEGLELEEVPWLAKGAGSALRYTSEHFVLVSNAREDIVRRAAVRLEQIYTAYVRFLPPRRAAGDSTTIYLVKSLEEYRTLLKKQGKAILHPAFYDTQSNKILCASDLQRLGDDLEQVRQKHKQILDTLKENEAELNARYKGKIPTAVHNHLKSKRQEVYQANLKNDAIFKDATHHLFQTLYHEAFHAYLANFVYPPDEAEVPRWLNEGLAQIFETAIVEAGELRVGHADTERLKRVQDHMRKEEFLPLVDLLRASSKQFLVNHATDQQVSDHYYLSAWALAFYLTFDRQLLGTTALDRYVHALKQGTEPQEAFCLLTGKPLSQFEQEFRQYLAKLRTDGTSAKFTPSR